MTKDKQARRWQITINNPLDKGFDHERIKSELQKLKPVVYWCMADETGEAMHTHLYIVFSGGVRFSTLQKIFENQAHLEAAKGTSRQNRDYIAKEGKWLNNGKHGTSIPGTFEEWGEMPRDSRGFSVESEIITCLEDGATNAEILREYPKTLRMLHEVEYARQTLAADENRNKWRNLRVTYIWGPAGTGKTRYVMEKHGYGNVYTVNDYRYPFDGYAGEKVMLFDEFTGNFSIQEMNNYLDGYPLTLPARYANKQACYETVYIISNLNLTAHYKNEQIKYPDIWEAFIRRIHTVIRFWKNSSRQIYGVADYLAGATPGLTVSHSSLISLWPMIQQLQAVNNKI